MKQILYILVAAATVALALAFSGCTKDNGKLAPNSVISIRPAQGVKAVENPAYLSGHEVVKQAENISWKYEEKGTSTGILDERRDTINDRLIMPSIYVIGNDDRGLTPDFIEGRDIVLTTRGAGPNDTIAYIPNAEISLVEKEIKAAYADENYTECYRLFDQKYRFTPINGADYRKLQEAGKN